MKKVFFLIASALIITQAITAGGYRVNVQGTRQIGMGHTGVSLTGDASSIFFNPASLTEMDKQWSFVVSGTGIASKASFRDPSNSSNNADTDNPLSTPFNAYIGYKANDRIALGLGVYTPFGSAVDWGNDWSHKDLVTKIELQSIYFQPTVSIKLAKWMSIGAGFTYATGNINLEKSFTPSFVGSPDLGNIKLTDDVSNYGYNLGVYFHPFEQLSIGGSYRSRIIMHATNGKAELDPKFVAATGVNANDTWTGELPLPAEITLGASYQITKRWLLAIDMNYALWSTYEDLTFEFGSNPIGNYPPGSTTSSYKRNYEDVMSFRIGTEYKFNNRITGRMGYYYDPSPSPSQYFSPETPTVITHGYSAGASISVVKNLKLELAYLYVDGSSNSIYNYETGTAVPLVGDFDLSAQVFSVGLNYAF